MAQSFDYSVQRPNYNAVNINIKKPEVNTGNNMTSFTDINGNYNAVNIEIDNPAVNTEQKKIYDYPIAQEIVTYEQFNPIKIPLPSGFPVNYHTTNVILPNIENEIEIGDEEEIEEVEEVAPKEETPETEDEINKAETQEETQAAAKNTEVPAPNYTDIETEKGIDLNQTKAIDPLPDIKPASDNKTENVKETSEFKPSGQTTPEPEINIKKPEIIPAEEILPEVDIPLVVSNLRSEDYDTQAQQMEEIARISLDNPENAVPYIVRNVFSSLIEIAEKDSTNLAGPSEQQVEARKKMIANFLVLEDAAMQKQTNPKLPYKLTEADFVMANELSPMEMAERNKEYALYTIAILAKVYTDEVEKQTGNVVPLTDLPGSSAIVDALRYSPNAGVKIAAIDALKHIQRPEYSEELTALYTLAQADPNPQVALAASGAQS